jgi:membrane protein required for colicin V production
MYKAGPPAFFCFPLRRFHDTTMHVVDILFIIVALIFLVLGIWRGIISEVFRIVALIGGFTAALFFHRQLAAHFGFLSAAANVKANIAFVIIFVTVLVLILLIGWGFRKAVQFATLGWIDRLIGGVLGIAKALILAWIFYAIVSFVPSNKIHASVDSSRLFRFFKACPMPVPKLDKGKNGIDKVLDPKIIKSLKDAGKKIDDFGRKVDSVKTSID